MAAAASLLAAGCTTSGQTTLDINAISLGIGTSGTAAAGQRTVAFEWMDGAPRPLLDKLVAQLTREANARQIAVVSQNQPAQYRVSSYLTAHVVGQRTTITWVWDVFTADHERVVRLTGEVPGAPSERAWAAADDAVVARVAQDGMSRLAAFLAGVTPVPVASLSTAPLGFLPSSRP